MAIKTCKKCGKIMILIPDKEDECYICSLQRSLKERRNKEQQKPSEWIKERAKEIGKKIVVQGVVMPDQQAFFEKMALMDFLDSVAEGKYKL